MQILLNSADTSHCPPHSEHLPLLMPMRLASRALLPGFLLLLACRERAPLRIGVVLDADGLLGAVMAADDLNAVGGINGRKLELRVVKGLSSTSAKDALTAADSLATDATILAVVGHTNSNASLAASQVYNERHVVQIAPTSTAPLYSQAGPYSFRMVPSDLYQGEFLAKLVARDFAHSRVAVLYVNDDYGRGLHGKLAEGLADRDIHPVYDAPASVVAAITDVQDLAQTVVRARPDLIVWIGAEAELRQLLAAVEPSLPHVRVLASDRFSMPKMHMANARVLRGVRYVRFRAVDDASPVARELTARYERQYHDESSDQFLLAYDAVRLVATAIAAVGADRERIREYLAGVGTTHPAFASLDGPLQFDANGDPPPSYHLAEVTPQGSRSIPDAWQGK